MPGRAVLGLFLAAAAAFAAPSIARAGDASPATAVTAAGADAG